MREVQSLARALEMLDTIINSETPKSVTEMAEQLEIDKSTASRLLKTLENFGYIQLMKNSRHYTVGKRLYTIGMQLTNRHFVLEKAKVFIERLAQQTGECSHIGIYSSGKVLVADELQPETSLLRVIGSTGRRISLHNTALGKGLIAFGDYPIPSELPAYTPKTITSPEQLAEHLALIRQVGYALDDEENEPGVRCLSAPVFDDMGIVVATLGISGPTIRITYDNLDAFAAKVKEMALALSHELGY